MNPTPPSSKQAPITLQVLRLFWLAGLGILVACLYGWRLGWSTTRQRSDGMFVAGIPQIVIGGASNMGSLLDTSGSLWMRYFCAGNTAETRQQYFSDMLQKQTFGMQAFVGVVFTILAAVVSLF